MLIETFRKHPSYNNCDPRLQGFRTKLGPIKTTEVLSEDQRIRQYNELLLS